MDTPRDLGLLWLRVLSGAGMAWHGYGKVFGKDLEGLTEAIAAWGWPQPHAFAWAAALSEFAGGLLLVLGFKTRLAALFVLSTMAVAAFQQLAAAPLAAKELALAYGTVAGTLLLTGAGSISFDRWLGGKASKTKAPRPRNT